MVASDDLSIVMGGSVYTLLSKCRNATNHIIVNIKLNISVDYLFFSLKCLS